jgi:hypothetical protein
MAHYGNGKPIGFPVSHLRSKPIRAKQGSVFELFSRDCCMPWLAVDDGHGCALSVAVGARI